MTSLDELKDEYRELLRDGKTEQATDVAHKIAEKEGRASSDDDDGGDEQVETAVVGEEEDDKDITTFTDIDGIGDELAGEFREQFDSVDDLADANVDDLEPIPGVGKKRGEDILDQVR